MLTLFGASALTFMILMYALERRHRLFVLAFAFGCALSSAYGFLAGTTPASRPDRPATAADSDSGERSGYSGRLPMSPSILRLRRRLPLVAFILLAVLCLLLIGFACACFSDHPARTIDRAVSAPAATPAVIEVWSLVFLSLLAAPLVLVFNVGGFGRASPAQLQRFLF